MLHRMLTLLLRIIPNSWEHDQVVKRSNSRNVRIDEHTGHGRILIVTVKQSNHFRVTENRLVKAVRCIVRRDSQDPVERKQILHKGMRRSNPALL